MRFIFLAFILIPIIEIYFLITVGSAIGAPMTIGLILLTAFIGAFLVRAQGFATLTRVQSMLGRGEMPAIEIMEGVFLLVAGALLLTPGFFTDAIGFACLTPPLRRWLIARMLAAGVVKGTGAAGFSFQSGHSGRFGHQNQASNKTTVIDGEYRDLDDRKD